MTTAMPERLYKYRAFTSRTLQMLVNDEIYMADPNSFNDPLDSKPKLDADIGNVSLERLFKRLFEQRMRQEYSSRKSDKNGNKKSDENFDRIIEEKWSAEIGMVKFWIATEGDSSVNDLTIGLTQCIEEEIRKRYDKGVLSLAERPDCPLMWSHYGDQHNGICLGYSIPPEPVHDLRKVDYGGPRRIPASRLMAMLDGSDSASRSVDTAALLTKAKDWQYEREWRLLAPKGSKGSTLELEDIIFGLRFPDELMPAVVKAMSGREGDIKFFKVVDNSENFDLKLRKLNSMNLMKKNARRSRTIYEDFMEVDGEL